MNSIRAGSSQTMRNEMVIVAPRIVIAVAIVACCGLATSTIAQEPAMHAGKLATELDRLANTGRVLYLAAHPDDENTRLLAYLANGRHVGVTYLAMTRGGGGQNLIGNEKAELLDVIRTEELLAARRLDGASQRFTRMRDFGYSKSADETLRIWGQQEALSDVVWVIRSVRPDVIISRFGEEPPNHGHHTASAILAREAFSAAADPERFPQHRELGREPWQADRLLRNVSHWRENPPPPNAIAIEVGDYDPRLGLGYGELAALSRSQHRSQGFGVAGERGSIVERFVHVAGTQVDADILEGLDLTWARFGPVGAEFAAAVDEARGVLSRDHPEAALPALLRAQAAVEKLPDRPRVRDARRALQRVIVGAAGLFVRATAERPGAIAGGSVPVSLELVSRRAKARVSQVVFSDGHREGPIDLPVGQKILLEHRLDISNQSPISAPYWLAQEGTLGRQTVEKPQLIGDPVGPPPLEVLLTVDPGDRTLELAVPVVFAWTDRVLGERERMFHVVPPATLTPVRDAVLFANGGTSSVRLRVRAGQSGLRGAVSLQLPEEWRSEPASVSVELAEEGDETSVRFAVTPGQGAVGTTITPVIRVAGVNWSWREDLVDYEHIPVQQVLRHSSLRLVPLSLTLPAGTIGYVAGSGDTVADDLRSLGMDVETVDEDTLRGGDLSGFAAIVVGIRAYNTREVVRNSHQRLMRYVEDGGNIVVQYQTQSRWSPLESPLGPFPMELGRERVTDESAKMEAVDSSARLLSSPNTISAADFEGWVQERGLYFAKSWDERYRPLFSAADPGEEPLLGSLLVAEHGKGRYVYTGLSFFRQLPAGVPGAYRLFANLIASDGVGGSVGRGE